MIFVFQTELSFPVFKRRSNLTPTKNDNFLGKEKRPLLTRFPKQRSSWLSRSWRSYVVIGDFWDVWRNVKVHVGYALVQWVTGIVFTPISGVIFTPHLETRRGPSCMVIWRNSILRPVKMQFLESDLLIHDKSTCDHPSGRCWGISQNHRKYTACTLHRSK